MSDKDRSNYSICENSMKLVGNIIRLSSFSIAKMGLGATGYSVTPKGLDHPVTGSFVVPREPFPSQVPGSQGSREPQSTKAISFLMHPTDEGKGSVVVREEHSAVIDGKASAYISKVHEKNIKALLEMPEPAPDILLPLPPRRVK